MDDKLLEVTDYKSGFLYCFISFIIFQCINIFFYKFPYMILTSASHAWKLKNITISFIHSLITGIWSLLCFYWLPKMAEDLINISSKSSHILVCFSIGYFIFDFLDMALHHHKRSSFELMIHHAFVIVCFGVTVVTRLYIGYAVVALLVEVNSIFLHMRQLLLIIGMDKGSSIYRYNALANIATFIVFRIVVLGWMTRWLVLHKDDLSLSVYSLGSIGLAVIVLMNIVLFYRICIVDFFSKRNNREANPKEKDIPAKGSHNMLFSKTPNFHIN